MNKKFLVVANWKANKTIIEAKRWMNDFYSHWDYIKENLNRLEIAIAAPYTLLNFFEGPHYDAKLTSQDISLYPTGAYTGEVPGALLKDVGVECCLIGHSERRRYFGETNEIVAKKFNQALSVGIMPIVCAQSEEEIPQEVQGSDPGKYALMYEPFSAISTNGAYHPEDPEAVQKMLSSWASKLPEGVRFLYGGSVNPDNVQQLMTTGQQHLSGFVVGHASLDAVEFFSIIKKCLEHSPSHS